ncbi:MAG: hypothetical protein ACOYXT_16940 [Bacteroidota bacterium]
MRVEELSSWTGLSWSINAGGIISRTQRGAEDEVNGYMNPNYTVAQLLAMEESAREEVYRDQVATGMLDTEPDIFNFNFGSVSGKFYYSQEVGDFIVLPRQAIFIDKAYFIANRKWRIKTADGTEYLFDLMEQNTSYSQCGGNASTPSTTVTGWFLTKIITPIAKEAITFNYASASYRTKGISSYTLYESALGGQLPECVNNSNPRCDAQNDYLGYRLESIVHKRGKVEFKANTDRLDLIGDKRLDEVAIYNFQETTPFKTFKLEYDYFNSSLFSSSYTAEQIEPLIRLKLKTVREVDKNGEALSPYTFYYNEELMLPSRHSYDQDSWGFYNGPKNNQHLVPPLRMGSLLFPGADRTVDTTYTGVAMISKIVYPTGGYTTFEFENHTTSEYVKFSQNETWVPKSVYLDVVDTCDTISDRVFCKPVVINNELGSGAFVSIQVDGIFDCEYCPNSSSCAVMSLEGTNFSLPITCNIINAFVPNGNYVLKANFTNHNNVAGYEDFVIYLGWEEGSIQSFGDSKVGGQRIKKITNGDGFGNETYQFFDYVDEITGRSSGVLVTQMPVYDYNLPCSAGSGEAIGGLYIVRSSFSNLPLGTTQGSHIGYSKVTVRSDASGSNGKTVFYYSTAQEHPDAYFTFSSQGSALRSQGYNDYPFAPACSYDHRRGLLLKQEQYKKEGGVDILVSVIENEYTPLSTPALAVPDTATLHNKSLGIKARPWGLTMSGSGVFAMHTIYRTASEWVRLTKTTERTYNGNDILEVVTTTSYDNPSHLQPTKVSKTESDGSQTIVYSKYALDYTNIPTSPTDPIVQGIKKLNDDFFVSTVLEKVVTKKASATATEKILSGTITTIKADKPLASELHTMAHTSPKDVAMFTNSSVNAQGVFVKDINYAKRIEFIKYDDAGNLLEQKKESDVSRSYVWGYNSEYPIAEVVNANYQDIFHTSFEEVGSEFSDANGVNISKTGKKVFDSGSYTVPASYAPVAGNLVMSYWYWKDDKWNFSGVVPFNRNITTDGYKLDEVRIYPSGSQMVTYTYNAGIGISSVTDSNNITSHYQYDDFGRLQFIRDDKGDILQRYEYHYRAQE